MEFEGKVIFCFIRGPHSFSGLQAMYKRWLWKRAFFCTGTALRDWRGSLFTGTLRDYKRGLWKRSVSLYGSSMGGNWREGSFTGNSESQILSVPRDGLEH